MKTKCTRGIIYFIGLIVLALGIVLNTKTLLGVSPIISIPYNICHIWHLNLGAITFVFYCFCVLIEAILKGKEFKLYELKDSVRYFYNKIIKIPKNALEEILKVMSVKKLDDILENDISLLTEYKGISKKTILKLQLNWDKFKNDKDLYSKFRALGFSNVLIKNIKEKFGRVDLLVYSAGIARSHKITNFPLADWNLSMAVNTTGYFLCAREVSKLMIEKEIKGRIIQINSKSGKVGSKHNSGYSAAKFGGVGLTQSLALDLAEHGITVNSLMLGNLLNSPMFQSLIPQYAKKLNIPESEVLQSYIDKVPMKRGCDYQDVLDTLVFYASEKAGYMTGQSINITGGQVMF